MENRRILINKLRLSIIFPFFDFKEVKKIFRYADSRRKKEKRRERGRRIMLGKRGDLWRAYAGHVSVVYRGKRSQLSSGSNCFEGK